MQMPPFHPPGRAGKTNTNEEKKILKKIRVPLIAVFLITSLFSCAEKKEANQKTDSDVQGKILATVNGVPITEYDVKRNIKRVAHGEKVTPEATQNILQTLVRNELIYQQSIELGLDNNQEYRRKLSEVDAQFRDYKKQEISNLYREYIKNKAAVTDSEAKEYFEKNSKRIQTKFHVWQIYYRGEEARIAEDYKELKSGKSFEKVASKRFPNLPKGMKAPWDLGYLYWSQIPAFWQGSIDRLEPGKVSDIIKGPNERFWVIKLVDKMVDPKITFATEKERIVEVLRKQKTDELSETMLSRMRTKSKIIFPKLPSE
ncbi:peptidyl-prolyl cis-trans isomerase [Candidatus Deferrimicrobium sp.]|uniref:peptidyl-prolyl cis-trans isomerase n=1 Tax=Candidatus Deferrimicrobium sp. TaxID=3060586 RepID=UPI002724B9E1|nr:peptidyl-prolyl cis-trans isomerase [Candidatus Deferrimicrobium sp.]MDO8739525.1 peptidyl-prolyl cis-trans isomerase [Candidatus Deferrimicrobium sp.]